MSSGTIFIYCVEPALSIYNKQGTFKKIVYLIKFVSDFCHGVIKPICLCIYNTYKLRADLITFLEINNMKQSQIITSFLNFLTLLDNFHKLAGPGITVKVQITWPSVLTEKLKNITLTWLFMGYMVRNAPKIHQIRPNRAHRYLYSLYNCLYDSYAKEKTQS